ncbi:TPA: adenosylcobinamide-GDP ribazoletransferase [Vibrio diabolicus]|uniref:Adenosylcobinamide-GDP ribazoletransferase n=1 Tax=Vibrio diabolicus TaxID=50719 RepID=A0AA92LNX1_9VIBR|nr:adenosylcobinamide-GDP ribazoletransferase [Vibrio diabolicus]QRG81687.1 adenosylcobinamide-GDP ribazoletransferase [Vibrio diabolicus]
MSVPDNSENVTPSSLRYQWELFLLAISFFSRLPVPQALPYSEERMNQAGRYFALVGLVLGALCALVFSLTSILFPESVAIVLTMVFSLLLTGAFHEDGLTDMADGIGGGMTVERRLSIMKDSRIGTYGAATLIMALLAKYVFWSELANLPQFWLVIVVAYTASRALAATLIYDLPYVSDSDTSKSKPLANNQSSLEVSILLFTGGITLLVLGITQAIFISLVLVVFRLMFKRWLTKRIGGFTGDCLGAAQQLSELLIYLTMIGFYHIL